MLLFSVSMFVSAFLLFLVQPLIGKYILPWFGGAPSVWTTCMLFFQALLLGGYGYAHALASRSRLRRQVQIHLALLSATILVVLWFSIIPSTAWKPSDDRFPVLRILGILLASIGAPYFLLSSTAPLLQSWFSRTHPASSPYRLYALSNLGSLLAIVGYPFLIEPAISLRLQSSIWTGVYIAFALMCAALAVKVWKVRSAEGNPGVDAGSDLRLDTVRPGAGRYVLWLSLTACSSIMLLSTTSMMCQDLAVVPLLWILPLAVYLLTFILTFQYERLYWRPLFIGGMAASIAWSCFVLFGSVFVALSWQILSYCLTLFTCCMVCHGELVRLKPGPRYLTSFYLMVAGGGALGGLLVTVGAPYVLKGFWEYHIGLLATVLLTLVVLYRDRRGPLYHGRPLVVWTLWGLLCVGWAVLGLLRYNRIWQSSRFQAGLLAVTLLTLAAFILDRKHRLSPGRPPRVWAVWVVLFISWVALGLVLGIHIQQSRESSVEAKRNFFGVLRVLEFGKGDPETHTFSLMHGRIEHGYQFPDSEMRFWNVSYYGPDSGIGLAMRFHPRRLNGQSMRVGVIGLGTGTVSSYGQPGDYFRYYEINPDVVELSDKYFTYRKDSPARSEVVLGDARISLERERLRNASQQFDVLVVDAFSSDAIPVHLLTRECFEIYRYHLKPDGIVAFHITNRYFDLSPIVRNLAAGPGAEMKAIWVHDPGNGYQRTDRTDWVLLTANRQFLETPEVQWGQTPWPDPVPAPEVWTDDYSNLFRLIHERSREQ